MNNEIKVVVAEDETPLLTAFTKLLNRVWPEAEVVAACNNGEAAIAAVAEHQPQVVFLDIRMPKKNGLEVAKEIGEQAFVVFTTAYDEYAVAAFESGAVDYLLKPIEQSRLVDTITRLETRLLEQKPQNLTALVESIQAKLAPQMETLKWVTASAGDTVKMISVDDIVYFQADQKYTKVVTDDDEAVIRLPLKDLISRLDSEQFWQVHRSTIVAVDSIDALKKDELGRWQLKLRGKQETLPVSKEFQRKLKAL